MNDRVFSTREREDLFLRLAGDPNGTTAPEVYQAAVDAGDRVTREAYQNLGRRLVHRGVLVVDTTDSPIRYRAGQNVDGYWLEEEELAGMVSDEYPLLLLPIWRESLRQIQHVPEDCWAFLRGKLASEDARSLFARAIMSYCDDLADLLEVQVDAQSRDAPPRDIARNGEEGRNAILILRGLVRFGLGISIEAVKLPDNFDDAVQQRRSDPTIPQVDYDRNLLTAELRWRVEEGPFVRSAQAAMEGEKLIAAVDGSSRTGVMSLLGEENDFYVGHAPMITVNTAVGLVNRRVRIAPGQEYPAFARLPEKPEDMQQRDNRYTVMTKLFFPDLTDAEYMHALWNGMDVLAAKTTLRVLSRWYTNPGGIEMPPSDLVMRDGTVVPQDRDFNHYKDSGSAGRIVRDMIELNWEIAKKCKDDGQTVAGVVKTANLRIFGPVLNWFVTQAAARKELGPIEAWPMRAMNTVPDQMLLTRLLTAERRPGDPWARTALTIRPFHATTNFAKTNSIKKTPIERIHERQVKELDPSYHGGFESDVVFWKSFRGSVDPYVQMLRNVAYASCFIATVPRLEVDRYLPRIEFILPLDVYGDPHPEPLLSQHLGRVCDALERTGFEVSLEHSMFRDKGTLEVLPELVARAHDTVKTWARELGMRLEEYLTQIIGRHIQSKRQRGIRVRPFTRAELTSLHDSLERDRRQLGGSHDEKDRLDA